MRFRPGVEIETVEPGSPADRAGITGGDVLLSLNGKPLRDIIDFMYHRAEGPLVVALLRDGNRKSVAIDCAEGEDVGMTFSSFKVRTCRNNCIFCFVKQLPKGLRRPLYVKDEDYRLSFLYGNYITLSNLDARDRKRIVEQRLSPLYISVHSTNRSVRNTLLGTPKGLDIMKELKFFADHKIRMHVQVVLCPGYNDGKDLQSTVRDLHKFYPYVSSVAVVPVGLTAHRRQQTAPVTREDAVRTLTIVEAFQKRFKKRHGEPVVYCSDEMYIKAERPLPPLKEYGALHQLENGVGMVPLFLAQAKRAKAVTSLARSVRFVTFTGVSFFPFLKKFIDRISEREGILIEAVAVENAFFGKTVTVAGLLTGRDVIKTFHDMSETYDILLVPDVALKEDEDIFLDDVSLADVSEATGRPALRIEATPQGLIDAISSCGQQAVCD